MSNSLQPRGLQTVRSLCPWTSPGQNTGVGSHSLLQGIFPTQGWNPGLPHCRQILYPLSHQGRSKSIKPTGIECFCVQPGRVWLFLLFPLQLSSLTSGQSPSAPVPPCSLFFNSRKNTGLSHLHTSCSVPLLMPCSLPGWSHSLLPSPPQLTLYSSTQVSPLPGRLP